MLSVIQLGLSGLHTVYISLLNTRNQDTEQIISLDRDHCVSLGGLVRYWNQCQVGRMLSYQSKEYYKHKVGVVPDPTMVNLLELHHCTVTQDSTCMYTYSQKQWSETRGVYREYRYNLKKGLSILRFSGHNLLWDVNIPTLKQIYSRREGTTVKILLKERKCFLFYPDTSVRSKVTGFLRLASDASVRQR